MPDMLAIDCRDNKVFPKKMLLKLNIFKCVFPLGLVCGHPEGEGRVQKEGGGEPGIENENGNRIFLTFEHALFGE